jgi:hypothetical protein
MQVTMMTPYREIFIESAPVETATGHCPWCRAVVEFVVRDRFSVCDACDATFATAIARVTEGRPRPPASASSAEIALPVPRASTRMLGMLMFLVFELGLIAIFLFAIGRS